MTSAAAGGAPGMCPPHTGPPVGLPRPIPELDWMRLCIGEAGWRCAGPGLRPFVSRDRPSGLHRRPSLFPFPLESVTTHGGSTKHRLAAEVGCFALMMPLVGSALQPIWLISALNQPASRGSPGQATSHQPAVTLSVWMFCFQPPPPSPGSSCRQDLGLT